MSIFKTGLFGYDNFKRLLKEIVLSYSDTPSLISKKRVESSIAFFSAIGIILCYVWIHRMTIGNSEMLADVVILFGISGYNIAKIQQEKKDNLANDSKSDIPN